MSLPVQAARRTVLASGNPGKLRELHALLAGTGLEVEAPAASDLAGVRETGLSFVENAILKARHASRGSGLPAIADDSGLVVDALDGAPGVYSARYAGEHATDEQNVDKLLEALSGVPEVRRGARFHCALVYLREPRDPVPVICEGSWEGRVLEHPRGKHGFGYDPVFYVPTHGCSSAELQPAIKNAISHRGQALRALLARLPRA